MGRPTPPIGLPENLQEKPFLIQLTELIQQSSA